MIRTKIVATMGPAVSSVDTLLALFQAGCDVCRLNFSHGDLDQHLATLRLIREAAVRFDHPVAVLGDLCGPKIRLGKVADAGGTGGMPIGVGDDLVVQRAPILGANGRVSTIYDHFVDDVQVGDRVLVEDGLLKFVCTDKTYSELKLKCTVGGVLKSAKGINLPHTAVSIPSITDRDWECVDWAVENDLDYLALSFVRRPDDLQQIRQHLANRGSGINLIAKIEKAEAIGVIDAIIDASDGLMVARGDLGVEMDLADVPIIQKDLVRRCQAAGKPVIVATQMLQSMIDQPSPTRAEVSDVANAIWDGTDAVMLSGETSVGKFPVGAVHVMSHVAEKTEQYLQTQPAAAVWGDRRGGGVAGAAAAGPRTMQMSSAVARGVWQVAQDLKVKLVVVWSQTGATARIFSKARFNVPVVALSSDHRALRRMALHYGVVPHEMAPPDSLATLIRQVDRMAQDMKFAAVGDRVVIAAGASLGTPSTMNGIVIHTIGEVSWGAGGAADASLRLEVGKEA
ncbi:MAG: pyruvate kinase [Phycisphaerales bacterium]|nr:pyruvate kinase [Phycisphaerales bacterium]